MAKVRYIGSKKFQVDREFGSNGIWHGKGSVCEVPDRAAKRLAQYKDMYEVVTDDGVVVPQGDPSPDFSKNPEKASLEDLREVAEDNYGVTFPCDITRMDALNEVNGLMAGEPTVKG